MVGQGDVATRPGTVHGAARTRAPHAAVLCAAISGDPRRRRHGRRVDLVAGGDGRVPQTVALQATAAQVPSGAGGALLRRRHRRHHYQPGAAPDPSSHPFDAAAAASAAASARDGESTDAAQKLQEASEAPEASFR